MGKQKGSNRRVRTTVWLPDSLHRAAKLYAIRGETTLTELIVKGLKAQLKERAEDARQ
jgi:hypothetical protein